MKLPQLKRHFPSDDAAAGTIDRAGIEFHYDPAVCDLCGSSQYGTILDLPRRSMTSDSQIVESGLRKIQCSGCDLARNGYPFSYEDLRTHYEEDYELGEQAAVAEPLFFTRDGAVPRSRMIFEWIAENLKCARVSTPGSIMEIGCGEGSLLSHFAEEFKGSEVFGIEVSQRSVRRAAERGLNVAQGTYRDVDGSYDLIHSFAVIEHVPSPSDFLYYLKSRLNPGGVLVTAQPCQDGDSYDIFFSDHLHHFFSDHVAALGARAGLREIARSTRHPYIIDFSLHVFTPDVKVAERIPTISSANYSVAAMISKWTSIFDKVDEWLADVGDKPVAVWGVGQMFTFLCAYTRLGSSQIAVAFDDNPERFAETAFDIPVMRFEEADDKTEENLPLLLTFVPGEKVLERLRSRRTSYFCPLASQ